MYNKLVTGCAIIDCQADKSKRKKRGKEIKKDKNKRERK